MRAYFLFMLPLLWSFSISLYAQDRQEADRAIAEIEKRGGKVRRDDNRPGKPVISVNLGRVKDGDACLKHIKTWPKLEDLQISFSPVTDAGLKNVQDLRTLGLSTYHISDPGIATLKQMKLESLFVTSSKKGEDGAATMACPGKLPFVNALVLAAAFSNVKDEDLASLKGVTNLRGLMLSDTKITDAGLAHLKGLTSLVSLDLSFSAVTDEGLKQLHGLDNLKSLNLRFTKVTEEGKRALEKALPGVVIQN